MNNIRKQRILEKLANLAIGAVRGTSSVVGKGGAKQLLHGFTPLDVKKAQDISRAAGRARGLHTMNPADAASVMRTRAV